MARGDLRPQGAIQAETQRQVGGGGNQRSKDIVRARQQRFVDMKRAKTRGSGGNPFSNAVGITAPVGAKIKMVP